MNRRVPAPHRVRPVHQVSSSIVSPAPVVHLAFARIIERDQLCRAITSAQVETGWTLLGPWNLFDMLHSTALSLSLGLYLSLIRQPRLGLLRPRHDVIQRVSLSLSLLGCCLCRPYCVDPSDYQMGSSSSKSYEARPTVTATSPPTAFFNLPRLSHRPGSINFSQRMG